jgi:hypothetical protein
VTAAQALVTACEECKKVCQHVRATFDAALEQYAAAAPAPAPAAGDDAAMSE